MVADIDALEQQVENGLVWLELTSHGDRGHALMSVHDPDVEGGWKDEHAKGCRPCAARAALSSLVATAKELEQSLVATRNALSGTQRVRDDYKARAERAERERAELIRNGLTDLTETARKLEQDFAFWEQAERERAETRAEERRWYECFHAEMVRGDEAEARVAALEGALAETNLRVGTVLMALGFISGVRTGFHTLCERELTEADEIARAALADPDLKEGT